MTRINLVDPTHLSSRHLQAEYHEITRVFTNVKVAMYSNAKVDIPARYTLGEGHVRFFYDKITWVESRFEKLYSELKRRGYILDKIQFKAVLESSASIGPEWRKSWEPRIEEVYLNMARLCNNCRFSRVRDELMNGQ